MPMQVPINGDYRYSVATMNAHAPNTFMSLYGMPNSRSSLTPSMDVMLLHTMVSTMPLNGGFMNQVGTLDYTMPNGTPDALQNQRPMSSFVAPTGGDYYHPDFGGQNPESMPLDDQIIEATRRILATSDLMTMTKKEIRQQLAQEFNVDLASRKYFISDVIDLMLSGAI